MADLSAPEARLSPVWRAPDGSPISCIEKLKVLADNLAELRTQADDALAEAVLMGCDPAQVRAVFAQLMTDLDDPYRR